MADVVVVGGGRCGLGTARALAGGSRRVTLVERLPVCGGQEPEPGEGELLTAQARAADVELMTGTMAVAWDGRTLSTLGVRGAVGLEARALVVATGSRPATAGELMIAGDRCAGVLPGSAALHLIEAGMLPGRTPAILGGGSLARSCCQALAGAGVESIALIAPEELCFRPRPGDRTFAGWTVQAVHGASRISSITLVSTTAEQRRERLLADTLILAHRRVPMRNIEGAVIPVPGVVFCQTSTDPKRDDAVEAAIDGALNEIAPLLTSSRPESVRRPRPTEVSS